jgi:threonine aldolase
VDDDRWQAAVAAARVVAWRERLSPAEDLARLARGAEELGIDRWDGYGAHGAVERIETEVADLLGKPAAVLFPSGVQGQQAALRAWCDRTGSRRVALPDRSHLLHHEEDGPRLLHDFRFEPLTTGLRTPTADDLAALAPGLGAVLVELPLRDAGCLLPTWDELAGLSAACREADVPLHVDGARLWESRAFYDRPLAEIAGLADSVYVSLYKGLGALSGALVAGPADLADELRVWRRRLGGTLYRLTPYAVGGLLGLRDELPRLDSCVAWARDLAAALVERGLRVAPDPPHTNTFLVHLEGDEDAVGDRLCALVERERVVPSTPFWASPVPGWLTAEVAVHGAALDHDPGEVAGWFASLRDPARVAPG